MDEKAKAKAAMMHITDGCFVFVSSMENPFAMNPNGVYYNLGVAVGDKIIYEDGNYDHLDELLKCQVIFNTDKEDSLEFFFDQQIIAVVRCEGGFSMAKSSFVWRKADEILWALNENDFLNAYYIQRKNLELAWREKAKASKDKDIKL